MGWSYLRGNRNLGLLLLAAGFAMAAAQHLAAIDYADPSDFILSRQQSQGANLEIDGVIVSVSSNQPAWYGLLLQLGNGKRINVVVYPRTKFWGFDNKAMASADAYPHLVQGQKVKTMHNADLDADTRHVMVTDLGFAH